MLIRQDCCNRSECAARPPRIKATVPATVSTKRRTLGGKVEQSAVSSEGPLTADLQVPP